MGRDKRRRGHRRGQNRTGLARARGAELQARTALAQTRFLRVFAACGVVLRASVAAKVSRSQVYAWIDEDARFRDAYEEAKENAIDLLEEEARRRALTGWLEPVYQGGKKVGTIRKKSDAMLSLLLKGLRKDVFSERQEHTGKDGGPIGIQPVHVSYHEAMKPPEYPRD